MLKFQHFYFLTFLSLPMINKLLRNLLNNIFVETFISGFFDEFQMKSIYLKYCFFYIINVFTWLI